MTRPKLLLADDSSTIRDLVEQTFTDEGIDVTTVSNGDDAMRRFVDVQPDILILDVNMPEPTGYRICEMIKQDESTRHIPVLLVVGSFEPFDQGEAERVGADGFLTKPFQSTRDLIVRVEELLGIEKATASAAETADIDDLYDNSLSERDDKPDERSVGLIIGDAGVDDEIIETSHPSENGTVSEDRSAPAKVTVDAGAFTYLDNAFEPPLMVDDGYSATDLTREEPSEEFIALVTRRVVEKLSDKVVREIAREAVPQIAEKLIREALRDEKKN